MKRFLSLISIIMFVLAINIGESYAAAGAVTISGGTPGTNGSTGAISITAANGFARQTDAITFTTSLNVYAGAYKSASGENYSVSAGHASGDKAYAIASSGGGVYSIAKTAGSSSITAAPAIDDTGAVTWTNWTAM